MLNVSCHPNECDTAATLHPVLQVIILGSRVAELILELLQRAFAAESVDELFHISTSKATGEERTIAIKLSLPFLSLLVSHHIPPPSALDLIYEALVLMVAGVS